MQFQLAQFSDELACSRGLPGGQQQPIFLKSKKMRYRRGGVAHPVETAEVLFETRSRGSELCSGGMLVLPNVFLVVAVECKGDEATITLTRRTSVFHRRPSPAAEDRGFEGRGEIRRRPNKCPKVAGTKEGIRLLRQEAEVMRGWLSPTRARTGSSYSMTGG
jgi:hypothetical protein